VLYGNEVVIKFVKGVTIPYFQIISKTWMMEPSKQVELDSLNIFLAGSEQAAT
jgi:hypothetical protein